MPIRATINNEAELLNVADEPGAQRSWEQFAEELRPREIRRVEGGISLSLGEKVAELRYPFTPNDLFRALMEVCDE